MDHKLGDTFYGTIQTHSPSTGQGEDADALPTLTIYENGTAMGLTPGSEYTVVNLAGDDGLYTYSITWTSGNGFEAGKMYSVVAHATMSTIDQNKEYAIVHCVAKDIDDLHDFDQDTEEVDLGSIKGTALTQSSAGRLAGNFSEVWDNSDAQTTKNADDIGGAAANHPEILVDTDIDTVTDQTHFILTAAANDDDAYNGQGVVVYDASESDSPSVRTITDYDQATKTITLDEAPDFTALAGDAIKIFVTPPGNAAPTAAQVADAVWDETLADHDGSGDTGEALHDVHNATAKRVEFDIANGDQVIMEDDGSTPRVTRRHTEVSATEVGMVPQ